MKMHEAPAAEMLFEVSWEVCNKVGGIHTVIKSKLQLVSELYSRYVLIGPLLDEQNAEFEQKNPPPEWEEIFKTLEQQGIRCAYGTWRTASEPTVVLIDGTALKGRREELKYLYWDQYGVDSLKTSWEFEEPMYFSTAAGMLIAEYEKRNHLPTVAQCHEWMAGFAILHLKSAHAPVATVFTTHATMLGRSLMGNGHSLYSMLENLDVKKWAYQLNVQDKHLAEVACANHADVFTTVSEITGKEAEKILGRAPDVLLFNGFYTDKFPTFEETSIKHYQSKELLKEFAAYMFFPHYAFDLEKMLFFFTSGRYEFQNKGMDVLIEALGRLNKRLKDEKTDVTILMFFWVIMGRRSVKVGLLENKNFFNHIQSYVDWQSKPLLQKVIFDLLSGHQPGKDDSFTSDFVGQLNADVAPIRREGNPPLVTHDIHDEENDPVLNGCKQHGLLNREEDRIKVVLYPGYLDGTDELLNLRYYDATVGANLGIFPSHYEPWGYTPLESAVLGVPAVTTDLAGFGRYIESCDKESCKGLFVIQREGKSNKDVVAALTEQLHTFTTMDHEERVMHGYTAKNLAARCNWKNFIKHYIRAHNLALEKSGT